MVYQNFPNFLNVTNAIKGYRINISLNKASNNQPNGRIGHLFLRIYRMPSYPVALDPSS